MKISQVLSYTFLTVTITTTYALTEHNVNDASVNQNDQRLKKRSATVLMEPSEVGQYTHGTVVYTKNQNRFVNKRRKPSSWQMQGTPKIPKKIRRYPIPSSYSSSRKSRTPKPIYRPKSKPWASKPYKKNNYKSAKSTPYSLKPRDAHPTFAEPPFRGHYPSTFGEPPRPPTASISTTQKIETKFANGQEFQPPPYYTHDMYKTKNRDTYKYPSDDFSYPQHQYDGPEEVSGSSINQHKVNVFNDEEAAFGQDFKGPQFEENYMDNTAEFSKHHPVYAKPHPSPNDVQDDSETKHHTIENLKQMDYVTQHIPKEYNRPKMYPNRHQHITHNKFVNVRMKNHVLESEDKGEQLLVGGKYAEPPARIVQKPTVGNHPSKQHIVPPFFRGFEGSAFVSSDDNDNDLGIQSASMSPYVNYKNSNMAFSPQNLNDAFGIVEK